MLKTLFNCKILCCESIVLSKISLKNNQNIIQNHTSKKKEGIAM